MIRGIGMDIVDIHQFRDQLADSASTFVEGSFTLQERETVSNRPARDKTPHFAGRYAAKEAFIKAWSSARMAQSPVLNTVALRDIEVINDPWGRPSIALHGIVQKAVREGFPALRIHLSLSHDGAAAGAYVVLEETTPIHHEETRTP